MRAGSPWTGPRRFPHRKSPRVSKHRTSPRLVTNHNRSAFDQWRATDSLQRPVVDATGDQLFAAVLPKEFAVFFIEGDQATQVDLGRRITFEVSGSVVRADKNACRPRRRGCHRFGCRGWHTTRCSSPSLLSHSPAPSIKLADVPLFAADRSTSGRVVTSGVCRPTAANLCQPTMTSCRLARFVGVCDQLHRRRSLPLSRRFLRLFRAARPFPRRPPSVCLPRARFQLVGRLSSPRRFVIPLSSRFGHLDRHFDDDNEVSAESRIAELCR